MSPEVKDTMNERKQLSLDWKQTFQPIRLWEAGGMSCWEDVFGFYIWFSVSMEETCTRGNKPDSSQFRNLPHWDESQEVQAQEMHIPVAGCGNPTQCWPFFSSLFVFLKEAAVKIAINEQLSKAVIVPIKLSGISGQCDMLFSHLFVFMLFPHLC